LALFSLSCFSKWNAISGGSKPLATRATTRGVTAMLRLDDALCSWTMGGTVAIVTEGGPRHSEFLDPPLD
jgi:hypothetical protein